MFLQIFIYKRTWNLQQQCLRSRLIWLKYKRAEPSIKLLLSNILFNELETIIPKILRIDVHFWLINILCNAFLSKSHFIIISAIACAKIAIYLQRANWYIILRELNKVGNIFVLKQFIRISLIAYNIIELHNCKHLIYNSVTIVCKKRLTFKWNNSRG